MQPEVRSQKSEVRNHRQPVVVGAVSNRDSVPLIANVGMLVYPRLEHLCPHPANADRAAHYDPVALDELAASIRAQGVLEPIVVRPAPGTDARDPHFQIIAGQRRWAASKLAGETELIDGVPVRLFTGAKRSPQ